MASMISLTPSNVQVLRPMYVGNYVGLRPVVAGKSVCTMTTPKVRPLMVIRASSQNESSVKTSGQSNEECEANAVAGSFPDVPPFYRPSGPKGTPDVKPLVRAILLLEAKRKCAIIDIAGC